MPATNYPGNPTATETPSPQPLPGSVPVIAIPAGTDAPTIESITQQMKVSADYHAYQMSGHFRSFEQENFNLATNTITTPGVVTGYARLSVITTGGASNSVAVGLGKSTLTPGSATSQAAYVYPSGGVSTVVSSGQVIFEVDFIPNVSFANCNHYIGVGSNTALLTGAVNYVRVQLNNSNQWVLNLNGVTTTLTGFTATIGTMQRVKLACYSATSPTGIANANTALTQVYINNVLAGSTNGTQLGVFPSCGSESTVATTATATVQTMTWQWNRF